MKSHERLENRTFSLPNALWGSVLYILLENEFFQCLLNRKSQLEGSLFDTGFKTF